MRQVDNVNVKKPRWYGDTGGPGWYAELQFPTRSRLEAFYSKSHNRIVYFVPTVIVVYGVKGVDNIETYLRECFHEWKIISVQAPAQYQGKQGDVALVEFRDSFDGRAALNWAERWFGRGPKKTPYKAEFYKVNVSGPLKFSLENILLVREDAISGTETRPAGRETEPRFGPLSPGSAKHNSDRADRGYSARREEDVLLGHDDSPSLYINSGQAAEDEKRPAKRRRENEEGDHGDGTGTRLGEATGSSYRPIPAAPRAAIGVRGEIMPVDTSVPSIGTLSLENPSSPTTSKALPPPIKIAVDPRLPIRALAPQAKPAASTPTATASSGSMATTAPFPQSGTRVRNDQLGTPSPSPRGLGQSKSLESSMDLSPWAGNFPLSSNPLNTRPVNLGPFPRYVGIHGDQKLIIAREATLIERADDHAKILSVDQLDDAALDQLGMERVNTYRWKVAQEIRTLYEFNQECLALGPKQARDKRPVGI